MRHCLNSVILSCFVAVVVMTFSVLPVEAYPTYSERAVFHPAGDPRCRDTDVDGCEEPVGNCQTCHGHFRATNADNSSPYLRDEYVSPADGRTWSEIYQEVGNAEPELEVGLHDVHRHIMVDKIGRSRCSVCHTRPPFYPVFLDSSTGSDGLEAISCGGCHGRNDDMANGSDGLSGRSAGLRQHHTNAGVPICKTCHADADPANYTPVGEDVLPSYYAVPNDIFVNKPTDPCSQRRDEDYAGGPAGLDNDGDGRYDKTDLDCQPKGPGNNNRR